MFKHVNIGYFIVSFILFGLLLASWSMLVAAPFARYPTIAAITCEYRRVRRAGVELVWQIHGLCVSTHLVPQ